MHNEAHTIQRRNVGQIRSSKTDTQTTHRTQSTQWSTQMLFEAQRMFSGLTAVAAIVAIAPTAITPIASAQVANEAREVLERSDRAIKEAGSFTYTSRFFSEGPMANFDFRGEVSLVRGVEPFDQAPQRYQGVGTIMGQERHFDVATDGRVVMWPVQAESIVYERPLFERRNDGQTMLQQGRMLRLENLVRPNPFGAELQETNSVKLIGREVFQGIECDVVEIVTTTAGGGTVNTRWHIAVSDNLPRQRRMITTGSEQQSAMSLTVIMQISDIKPGKLTAADFNIPTPPGFTRVEWTDPRDATAARIDTEAEGPVAAATGPAIGQPAPDLVLDLTSGDSFSIADKAGRVVVLSFIDPRLAPSLRVLQTLQAIARDYDGRAVDFVVLAARQPAAQSINLFRENNITLPLTTDAAQHATKYNVRGFPTTVVIDTQGNVATVEVGLDEAQRIDRRLRVMLDRLTR